MQRHPHVLCRCGRRWFVALVQVEVEEDGAHGDQSAQLLEAAGLDAVARRLFVVEAGRADPIGRAQTVQDGLERLELTLECQGGSLGLDGEQLDEVLMQVEQDGVRTQRYLRERVLGRHAECAPLATRGEQMRRQAAFGLHSLLTLGGVNVPGGVLGVQVQVLAVENATDAAEQVVADVLGALLHVLRLLLALVCQRACARCGRFSLSSALCCCCWLFFHCSRQSSDRGG